MTKKKILLLTTGGTIASHKTEHGPALTAEEILEFLPFMDNVCSLEAQNLFGIDSTNMTCGHWMQIAHAIEENYEAFDGFVVCHGTDTMAYTAAALSYMIQNSAKPIVLTGSQRPLEMEISDARMNLRDSIAYALDDASSGVSLVFGGKIIAGTRAKKVKTMSYNAFASINYPELAVMRDEHLVRYIEPKPFTEPVSFCHELNPRVFLLKLTPGMSPVILKDIFSQYDGIIVESFGVGGIPDSLLHEFVRLMEEYGSSKAVVMTTQVTYEGSNIGVYEVGKRVQEQFPLLEAYDMNLEAVLTKLMWILGQRPGSFEAVRELFYKIYSSVNIFHSSFIYFLVRTKHNRRTTMPRGRKNKSLDERIQDTQQSIYNLEVRTQELYEELEELLRQKKNEELEKLSDALEEAGVSVDEVLAQLKTDVQENIA